MQAERVVMEVVAALLRVAQVLPDQQVQVVRVVPEDRPAVAALHAHL